jgi:hypothetical protein
MSYLTGPITRSQIKMLMDPKRAELANGLTAPAAETNPMSMPGISSPAIVETARPVVGRGVDELFLPVAEAPDDVVYQAHLLRIGVVHFSSTKAGVEGTRTVRFVNPILPAGIDWDQPVPPPPNLEEASITPAEGAGFGELPGYAMNAANYKQVEKDFEEWLYRNERAEIFFCPSLKAWSQLGESEAAFRARLLHEAHEARDAAVEKIRETSAKKLATLESKLRTAEGTLERQKAEANAAKMQAGVSVLGGILGSIFGRKSGLGSISRGTSAIGKATSAYKQHQDVSTAGAKVEGIEGEIQALQEKLETEIAEISGSFDPSSLPLEIQILKPAKTDVKVQKVALLWLPQDARGGKAG